MRWMNPYPPLDAFAVHSIRDVWKATLAVGGFLSVLTLLFRAVFIDEQELFLTFLSVFSFTAALWGMHKERQALTEYITWKHFS